MCEKSKTNVVSSAKIRLCTTIFPGHPVECQSEKSTSRYTVQPLVHLLESNDRQIEATARKYLPHFCVDNGDDLDRGSNRQLITSKVYV